MQGREKYLEYLKIIHSIPVSFGKPSRMSIRPKREPLSTKVLFLGIHGKPLRAKFLKKGKQTFLGIGLGASIAFHRPDI
jgi:hypothetical protein